VKSSAAHRLRLVSMPEGLSFILLMICVVLKSTTSFNAVPTMGWVHGILFILYGVFWLQAWWQRRWSFWWAALIGVLSLLPTGGFFAERILAREERADAEALRAAGAAAGAGAAPGEAAGEAASAAVA